jgi:putative flippase GtrA
MRSRTCQAEPRRSIDRRVAFVLVGALGLVVQLTTLRVLAMSAGLHLLIATAIAAEAAILHNFLWHEGWTWAARIVPFRGAVLARLLRFHLANGLVSIVGNVALMGLFVAGLALNYLFANVLAVAVCALLNFLSADFLVFRREGVGAATPGQVPIKAGTRAPRPFRARTRSTPMHPTSCHAGRCTRRHRRRAL